MRQADVASNWHIGRNHRRTSSYRHLVRSEPPRTDPRGIALIDPEKAASEPGITSAGRRGLG